MLCDRNPMMEEGDVDSEWQCEKCTYLNSGTQNICNICGFLPLQKSTRSNDFVRLSSEINDVEEDSFREPSSLESFTIAQPTEAGNFIFRLIYHNINETIILFLEYNFFMS